MMQPELALELPPVVGLTLSEQEMARLRHAGAGENELSVLVRVHDGELRAELVDFFCFICPQEYRRLRAVIRMVRWWQQRGHPLQCGADWIYHGAGSQFRGFGKGGSNDLRCFITRAIHLCCEEKVVRSMLEMKDSGQANVLLRLSWQPPLDTSREVLPPLSSVEQVVYEMPP